MQGRQGQCLVAVQHSSRLLDSVRQHEQVPACASYVPGGKPACCRHVHTAVMPVACKPSLYQTHTQTIPADIHYCGYNTNA